MPILSIRGSWYGARCVLYEGVYANLGSVPDTNYVLENTGDGNCSGFNFVVKKGDTGEAIYNSTSSAKQVSLYFDGEPQVTKYDCLNGNCVPSTQHNTDGIYQSLAECEAACSSGSGCNGECISKAKLSQLKNLANRLKRKNCGC